MLTSIHIHDFAIVESLTLDLDKGMTAITGETGAGKSIAIDALGLCLGERADPKTIRPNKEKAEIVATFSLADNPSALTWLKNNTLDEGEECILRRVITKEGRSRAFINGSPVTLSQQKNLGKLLIDIHGQHAHHQLLKSDAHLSLLDKYAGHTDLLKQMRNTYETWRVAKNTYLNALAEKETQEAKRQLLEYQINELNELNLKNNEFEALEKEHKRLSKGSDLAIKTERALELLSNGNGDTALRLLQQAYGQLKQLSDIDEDFNAMATFINEAIIQVHESSDELTYYLNTIDIDATRLQFLDERIASILQLARKHKVHAKILYETHQHLQNALNTLNNADNQLNLLEENVENAHRDCLSISEKLHAQRKKYAKKLNVKIVEHMHDLNMHEGQFAINIDYSPQRIFSSLGCDHVEFCVSTNKGQALQSLGKVASGGELSRISLAIQVITAQHLDMPSLIFDEVDIGISGATAAVVGQLLRTLGETTQVLCVTHLPQVAGFGHQHLYVTKSNSQNTTQTQVVRLDEKARIKEIARLLAGSKITKHTLANARELVMA